MKIKPLRFTADGEPIFRFWEKINPRRMELWARLTAKEKAPDERQLIESEGVLNLKAFSTSRITLLRQKVKEETKCFWMKTTRSGR